MKKKKKRKAQANSPCKDGEGFVSHDVLLVETLHGPRWKCSKCGKVLE